MNILGVNAYHPDAAAALICDGHLIFAAEEERFSRVKHHLGFPAHAIEACLDSAKISIEDLDVVTYSYCPTSNILPKIKWLLTHPNDCLEGLRRVDRKKHNTSYDQSHLPLLTRLQQIKTVAIEHHQSHLAAAFFGSPFSESTLISIDGMGDFCSAAVGFASPRAFTVQHRTFFPHSLGFLYSMITQMLGFMSFGDEYKVMGLAPYGTPRYRRQFRELVGLRGLSITLSPLAQPKSLLDVSLSNTAYYPSIQWRRLNQLLNYFKLSAKDLTDPLGVAADIAASLQERTEEIIFDLVTRSISLYGFKNVCFAGGVALNSVAAGKIVEHTPCTALYIPPAPADNGASFGSALHYWHVGLNRTKNPKTQVSSALLGTKLDELEIEKALSESGLPSTRYDDEGLIKLVAKELSGQKIVAWVQGAMEFGARALGNRSLLADPRFGRMRDRINQTVKNRELFRPLAPSIPEEFLHEFFIADGLSPFMEKVFMVAPEKRGLLEAVTHVDGSARVQTVSRSAQPLFWQLLSEFSACTGVPVLLNTSFNQQEPIVRTAAESIDTFKRADIDILVLGNFVVRRGC